MRKITFVALETYSLIGGLQQFNRRVVSALSILNKNKKIARPAVILKGDNDEHIKNVIDQADFFPCGISKIAFIKTVLQHAKSTDVLLLGHVNLLPLAMLSKLINPKLKTILFVHGVDVWGTNARKVRKIDRFLISFVDKIASVSSFTAQKMSEAFHISDYKFIVFPNAVDPLTRTVVDMEFSKKPLLLTVSRLTESENGKHHDSVLKALPHILEKIPDTRYCIIGDGVLRRELEELAKKLNVYHAVEFKGRVSDDDLAKSYGEASLFVMPSEKEGFGIVFLEAWLRKIPVICGTEDASHEIISHGVDGFAIHHNNIEELSKKIIWFLQHPDEAKKMGKAGEEKVSSQYVMANFITNLEALLKKINSVK